jgi:hypothetical protein
MPLSSSCHFSSEFCPSCPKTLEFCPSMAGIPSMAWSPSLPLSLSTVWEGKRWRLLGDGVVAGISSHP